LLTHHLLPCKYQQVVMWRSHYLSDVYSDINKYYRYPTIPRCVGQPQFLLFLPLKVYLPELHELSMVPIISNNTTLLAIFLFIIKYILLFLENR